MKMGILMNDVQSEKKLLRSSFKAIRTKLSSDFVISRSEIIYKKFTKLINIRKFNSICVYISFNNEVLTNSIVDLALKSGVRVAVPYVVNDFDMKLKFINNYNNDIHFQSRLSNPEPKLDLEDADISDISMFIVPALAFDEKCNRLGFSKGYYDRMLDSNKNALRIGLAYDYQILPNLPKESHDEILDLIISENKIVTAIF